MEKSDQSTPTGAADKNKAVRAARWLVVLAVLVLLAGTGIAAWSAAWQGRQEDRRREGEFRLAADKRFARTLREIQLFMEVLDSIRQLHSLSDQVSPAAFDEIARKGMIYQRRILGAYGFVQRIPHDLRAAYEQAGGAGRALVEADGQGGFRPVPVRAEYYPLTYQTPPGGLGIPTGYDFSAREEERAAVAAMARLGVFALAGIPPGLPPPGAGGELYMFAPILYPAERGPGELAGFAVGLFDPDRILAAATGDDARGVLARLGPATAGAEPARPWHFERKFSLGNQEWRFTAAADPAYWAAARSRAPQLVFAAGLTLAVALAAALLLLAGHARRVEVLVFRRTAELAAANRKLEAVMEERRELEDEVLRISGHEKARIGRDLHDSLGQKLTGAMYLFGAYRQHAGAGAPAAEGEAEQIAATLKEAVSQVRRIARGLAPVALTEDGLPDALRRLAEETGAMFQKEIEFYPEREGRPKDVATAEHLYLIAQEAVNNAVKHGDAARIVIALDYNERGGELTVEDNGQGFAANRKDDCEGGNGLRIMRHRAEVFGGELQVGPGAGGGVRVSCRFPAGTERPSPGKPQ